MKKIMITALLAIGCNVAAMGWFWGGAEQFQPTQVGFRLAQSPRPLPQLVQLSIYYKNGSSDEAQDVWTNKTLTLTVPDSINEIRVNGQPIDSAVVAMVNSRIEIQASKADKGTVFFEIKSTLSNEQRKKLAEENKLATRDEFTITSIQ